MQMPDTRHIDDDSDLSEREQELANDLGDAVKSAYQDGVDIDRIEQAIASIEVMIRVVRDSDDIDADDALGEGGGDE